VQKYLISLLTKEWDWSFKS